MTTKAIHPVRRIVDSHKSGEAVGIYSVCSANEHVLRAALRQALREESVLLVEATCNQVNQFGGYTNLTPARFTEFLDGLCRAEGFPRDALILGGDHLGPSVWQKEPAEAAMEKARVMVRDYVEAGFSKIHLDASMPCSGDPVPLPDRTVAERAADLCRVAEEAFRGSAQGAFPPVYVVGTEVPTPGGATEALDHLQVTSPEEARETLENVRRAFARQGLEEGWERVIALVVQPGVEFGSDTVVPYDPPAAMELSRAIDDFPGLVYEAHSTDYQPPEALKALVRDHFAILKVGPWLTFALREAVFALAALEEELFSARPDSASRIREVLESEMLRAPGYWRSHYHGDEAELRLQRRFSFSDRIRYYWQQPAVQASLARLIANLESVRIPYTLLHQYLPVEAEKLGPGREMGIEPLIVSRVQSVLGLYSEACRMAGSRLESKG